jgi:hypothetical protein
MDTQLLLNEDGDIDDGLAQTPLVPWAKDPLNLTADKCRLRLLHTEIKSKAVVPFNPSFNALPRTNPPRPFQVRLPERFNHKTPVPIDFFGLFLGDDIMEILV